MAGRFEGKQALVLGVANKRSIAWAIAERLAAEGAQLAFTYQGERIEKSVRDLAATVDTKLVTECDVRSDDDLDRVFAERLNFDPSGHYTRPDVFRSVVNRARHEPVRFTEDALDQ